MLRIFFFLLILANLLFFAWAQGYFGSAGDGREPRRLGNQLMPEKLHVVGIEPPSSQPSADRSCRLVSGMALSEAQRLMVLAKEKSPELGFVVKPNDTPAKIYWVLIPPLANRAAVDKKLAELKKRGVNDFSVILDEGADKFAILLGLFDAEPAASQYLQELAKRDVKSAKIETRVNQPEQALLEVRGPTELLVKRLPELLTGRAAASIGECPAGR